MLTDNNSTQFNSEQDASVLLGPICLKYHSADLGNMKPQCCNHSTVTGCDRFYVPHSEAGDKFAS